MGATYFKAFDTKRRPLTALRAVLRMLRDKEATHEVYRMTAALDGPNYERSFQEFQSSPMGQKVLNEEIDLLDTMSNTDYLKTLPENSLGRVYLDFITRENLTAQGFQDEMDASGESFAEAGKDRQRFAYRIRHTHDLQHVLTGYGRDIIGELSLLAFSQSRSRSYGIALLIFFGKFKARRENPKLNVFACIREGRRLGKQVRSFFDVDW